MEGLTKPEGWTLEPIDSLAHHVVLTSPVPDRFMATIDFRSRGIRTGYSTTGSMLGETWKGKRKVYGRRGWKQAIVDDAVAHLRSVMT